MSVSARRMSDGRGGEPRFHYLVRGRDGRRIEHARMFPTEGEAAEFDAEVKAGRLEPGSRRRRRPSPTFQAEAMGWLATGDIYRGVFKAVLNKAILDGRLSLSPCPRI